MMIEYSYSSINVVIYTMPNKNMETNKYEPHSKCRIYYFK